MRGEESYVTCWSEKIRMDHLVTVTGAHIHRAVRFVEVFNSVMKAHGSRATSAFQEFFRTEAAGGTLLVACACGALVAANSDWSDAYHRLWATRITIGAGAHDLSLTVHQWINDGLMAIFFLLGRSRDQARVAGRRALLPAPGGTAYRCGGRWDGGASGDLSPDEWWRRWDSRVGDPDGHRHRLRPRGTGHGGARGAERTQDLSGGTGHR